jgi:hypothetical protein
VAEPSITYWNRVEPSPRGDSLQAGLEAAVRDPLWFLSRQWQVGEFSGEDAASPAFVTFAARFSPLDSWRPAGAPSFRALDGSAPLEPLSQNEATTPDLLTAVELGQALEERVGIEGGGPHVIAALRAAFPVPDPAALGPAEARDRALVRLARVCGGRATHGTDALMAARASAPTLPPQIVLPPAGQGPALAALTWLIDWASETLGPIGLDDADGWRPERLEYGLQVGAATPDGDRVVMEAHAGPFGELDWYAFDELVRLHPIFPVPGPPTLHTSLLPAQVSFSGMPNARWWQFEDARFNWAAIDTDRRELGKVMVMDFMLIQSNDWFVVPFGQAVGTIVKIDQVLVRDVFGGWTLVPAADAGVPPGPARWSMYQLTADGADFGLAGYFLLSPGALRTTLDGPDLEEVRFVRDEQANMAWAVEAVTQDGTGHPWQGRERALDVPDPTPSPPATTAPLRYRLQTTVPVNWIPFLPVQVDTARRAVALERAAMQRSGDGGLSAVEPVGRVLRPTNLDDPAVYRVREEEVARSGTRVLRADRRSRWTDGSTHLWTSRRRRAGLGEAASGLRYDLAEPTDTSPPG